MAKIDDSVKKKVPELRFPGFTYDWEERKLKDVVEKQIKGKAQFEKLAPGEVEYLDTSRLNGGQAILTNGLKDVTLDDILILWDGSKAGTVYHGFEGALGSTLKAYRTSANSKFVYQYLKRHQDNIYNNYRTPNIPHVQKDFLNVFTISVPVSDEQEKIGSFFKELDDTIALHQRKLDLLKEQKKGYLQKMFPKNGAKVPELRFAGFADDWEERKLSSGLREYTDRVIVEDDKEYYQISVRNNFGGITLRGSKMGNKIGRKRQAKINLTKYPQTLIFTRQTVEQGGIGWVDKYCDGAIVTENMPTISLDTSVFSKYFLTNLFQTRIFYKNAILDNIEGGSAQIAIHESKFLSSTLLFPNLDEQQKIGQFFKQLDDTIDLHQRKLDLLKEQKKGYLQKMFPKNGAKVPELRFAGFADDWEERKLVSMTNYKNGKGHEDKQSTIGKFELINLNSISISGGLKHSGKFIDEADDTLQKDDLVMILSDVGHGDLLGRVALIPEDDRFVLNQRVALLRPNATADPQFLFSYINAHQYYFKAQGAGMSQLNISKGSVENFISFVPIIEEQKKIGTFFKQLDNTITLHQRKLDLLKEQKKGFLQKMFV